MISPVNLDLDRPRAPQAQRRVARRAIALVAAPVPTDVFADSTIAAAIVLAITVAAAIALPFFAAL